MSIYTQRLAAQIEFIKQCALIKKAPTQDFAKHNEFTCTEEQIIGLPGISLNVTDDTSEDVWLRLERLRENSAPKPSSSLLANWLKFPIKFSDQPLLQEKINAQQLINNNIVVHEEAFTPFEVEDSHQDEQLDLVELPEKEIYLRDFSEREALQDAFNDYLKNIWKPWVAKENLVRQSISLYAKLFKLNQMLQGNLADESLELVWGVGIAVRQNIDNEKNSEQIKYPLLTQSVEIALDQKTMALLIKPNPSPSTLETEPFSMDENQGLANLLKDSQQFYEAEDVLLNPFLPSSYEPILKSAVTLLDASGIYWPEHTIADERKIPKA